VRDELGREIKDLKNRAGRIEWIGGKLLRGRLRKEKGMNVMSAQTRSLKGGAQAGSQVENVALNCMGIVNHRVRCGVRGGPRRADCKFHRHFGQCNYPAPNGFNAIRARWKI